MFMFSDLLLLTHTVYINIVAIFHRIVIFDFFSILRTYYSFLNTIRLEEKYENVNLIQKLNQHN